MPDDGVVGGAVLDAVDSSVNSDIAADDSSQSTATDTQDVSRGTQDQTDRQDNRKQPDALKKHIADLRRRADSITDPVEKKAELDRIKFLYDTSGKARGYEEQFPTVREAREVKAFFEAVGGREGVQKMQTTLADVEQVDRALSAGDPSIIDRMWQEAPEGMPKLVPGIMDRFEREKPQEYEQFIAPKSVGYLDKSGFPQAFDQMVKAYESGDKAGAQSIRDQLIQWVVGNRQAAQQQQQAPKANPEMDRLRQENETLRKGDESKQVDSAYTAVVQHAAPAIDKFLKPQVAKLGLTAEQYSNLREQVWSHLETARNANDTYKVIAPSKAKQGYGTWTEYAKQWTDDNAEESARAMVKKWYGHQLQSGARTQTASVTRSPGAAQVQSGKQPSPSEIDYTPKGKAIARKLGYKDLADMLLAGQAPLKAGGIRKFR